MKETDDFLIKGFFIDKSIINRQCRGESMITNSKMIT